MSGRKHIVSENIENQCPVPRKRCRTKNSTASFEHASSPSALSYEALEEMGISMLDSEESSSSALSAIALAVSATSDDNSTEYTPQSSAPSMQHPQLKQENLSLNSTADTTLDNSFDKNNTVIEMNNEESQQRALRNSAEKLIALAQVKRAAKSAESNSNSNSPSKRTRNPLATVMCNSQNDPLPTAQPSLNLQPSTSKHALLRQQKKPKSMTSPVRSTTSIPNDKFFLYRLPPVVAHSESNINYFDSLSDEIILNIFKWLPKKTLQRVATVSRRFNWCARDETLWTRLDLGTRSLRPLALEQILTRGILVLRLAQANIQEPAFVSHDPSIECQVRLQYLDLGLANISPRSLRIFLSYSRHLKKLSLENAELNDEICQEIAENKSLEALNLAMCTGLTANGVRIMMESLTNLSSLNISWTGLSADAVTALVTHMPTNLIRLNVAGCRRGLFNSHITTLQKRCPQLLELDLSDCNSLTSQAIDTIMKFNMLEYLSVSRCYLITGSKLIELKNMTSLTYLDIFGMLSETAMEVLEKQLPNMGINKFMHSSVARPTVGTRRTSIWGLRTRD